MKTKILALCALVTLTFSGYADTPSFFRGDFSSPNSNVLARTGDLYTGLTLGQMWIKTGGYSNTGWVQIVLNSNVNALITKPQAIGYSTGSGGAITQITSSSTGVTLGRPSGVITTFALSNAAGAEISFIVTNSFVDVNDTVVASVAGYAGAGTPIAYVKAITSGTFTIGISNLHATTALNALATINFSIYKGSSN